MDGSFYIAATGLRAQQKALDIVANNIANINTPGFKRSQPRFSELLASNLGESIDASPRGADSARGLAGVSLDATGRIFDQGDLRSTGKPLDLAIRGEGFIELLGPGGDEMLWRGGQLKVNPDGYLAAMNGMPLKAMISVPIDATALVIGSDGKVSADLGSDSKPTLLGQIDLVRAKDMASLTPSSDGLYRAIATGDLMNGQPGEDGAGVLVQGSLESSNVQLTDEMVSLLLMQRAFSANAQVVQASDQLMSIINGLKR